MQADFPILPFADQSAEEVVLSHVLEHFGYGDALILTTEMARVLTLGGKAVIEVPDIEWCLRKFLESPEPPAYTNPSYDYNTEHRWGLYAQSIWGDQHNDGLFHKWGYTEARLSGLLKHAGLSSVRVEKLFSHGVQCLSAVATK
jgi:predicted SAM-dependent methyltransferase